MSRTALDDVTARIAALAETLDGQDSAAIQDAADALSAALERVRTMGAWHGGADLQAAIRIALAKAEAARMRINLLSDVTDRRIEALCAIRSGQTATAYARNGQRSHAALKFRR